MHSTMSFPLVWRQTRRPQPLGKTTTTTQGSLLYKAFSRNSKEMSSRTRPNSSLTDFPCCNVFLEQVHDVLLLLSGIPNLFLVSRYRKSIVDKWNTFESYDSNQEIQYERCSSSRGVISDWKLVHGLWMAEDLQKDWTMKFQLQFRKYH